MSFHTLSVHSPTYRTATSAQARVFAAELSWGGRMFARSEEELSRNGLAEFEEFSPEAFEQPREPHQAERETDTPFKSPKESNIALL
jgi:hypothetical protein